MGKLNDITVVKLGGSIVTHKDKPLSPNSGVINKIAKEISRAFENNRNKLFLIHGGGSYGHYYAAKYHVSVTWQKIASKGISKTAAAMISLHTLILDRLVSEDVPCKTVLSSEILSEGGKISIGGKEYLRTMFDNNLVPITFGNVVVSRKGFKIVSGDQIAIALAESLPVKRVIFVMDVDGIYPTSKLKGSIIEELGAENSFGAKIRRYDVTGGVKSKINAGLRIAKCGAEIYYVNGNKQGRLEALLSGGEAKSTHIPAMRISI